jgi:hypothetical protein
MREKIEVVKLLEWDSRWKDIVFISAEPHRMALWQQLTHMGVEAIP